MSPEQARHAPFLHHPVRGIAGDLSTPAFPCSTRVYWLMERVISTVPDMLSPPMTSR
jgi:hypothetical protein